jgi:trans-aconitate 2-methyltransferase
VTDTWSPAQYDKFQREREQPFFDLLAMVQRKADMRVVDLGCGTGRLTQVLHERLRARSTLGVDRSARMLEHAQTSELPAGLRFERGDIETFEAAGAYDLIFSNAAFHWVDDHETLISRLAGALTKGGQLAFQVPASYDQPPHIVAEQVRGSAAFAGLFGAWRRTQPVLAPETYARLLFRAGFGVPSVRLIVYPHVLAGPDEVVEWMKGTLLTEYARHLPPDRFADFVAAYRERLLERMERARPFFFPFKRILCWGRKTSG